MDGVSVLNSTEQILHSSLNGHLIRETDLENLFKGTPARRYGLVNKALKQKEWLSLRRGLYLVASKYQQNTFSAYYLANQIVPYSFVTAEAALQFHQWIPERVAQITSMAAFGRNKSFHTPLGEFIYQKSSVNLFDFLTGVERIEINNQSVLIASPLRALADYVYWHKIKMANMNFLINGLRIEEENIYQLKKSEVNVLMGIYKKGRTYYFLKNLLKVLSEKDDE